MATRKKILGFFVAIVIIALIVTVTTIGPEAIVDRIGVEQSYLFVFVFGLIAGSSTFTSGSFYVAVVALATGGLDPILLALAGGPGLIIGDLIHYFLGEGIQRTLPNKTTRWLHKISDHIEKRNLRSWIPVITYFWAGFAPFPVDLWMIFLSWIDYPMKKFIVPLALGEMTFIFVLSTVGGTIFG